MRHKPTSYDLAEDSERYGMICRQSIWRHIYTGNPSELEDAYYYARYAARAALQMIEVR